MLADGDRLLDKMVQILWEFWSQTVGLEDTHDLVTGDILHLSNTVLVTKDNTNLGWGNTLLGEPDDVFADLIRGNLEPGWWSAAIWQSRGGNTLTKMW